MNDFNYYLLNEEAGINLNYINYAFLALLEKDRDTFNSLSDIFKGFHKKYWYIDNTLSGYGKGNMIFKNSIGKIDFLNQGTYAQTIRDYINTNVEDYEYRLPEYEPAIFSIVSQYIDLMGSVYNIGDSTDLPNISISRKANNKDSISSSSWFDYLITDSTILSAQDIYDPLFELSMRNHKAEYHSTAFQRLSRVEGDEVSKKEAQRIYDTFLRKDLESIYRILAGLGNTNYNLLEIFKPKGNNYFFNLEINTDNTMEISSWVEVTDENKYTTDSMWELSRSKMVEFEKHYVDLRPYLNDDDSKLYYRFTKTPEEIDHQIRAAKNKTKGVREIPSNLKLVNREMRPDEAGLAFVADALSKLPTELTDLPQSELQKRVAKFSQELIKELSNTEVPDIQQAMTLAGLPNLFGENTLPVPDIENKLWEYKASDGLSDLGDLIDQSSKAILINLPKLDSNYYPEIFSLKLKSELDNHTDSFEFEYGEYFKSTVKVDIVKTQTVETDEDGEIQIPPVPIDQIYDPDNPSSVTISGLTSEEQELRKKTQELSDFSGRDNLAPTFPTGPKPDEMEGIVNEYKDQVDEKLDTLVIESPSLITISIHPNTAFNPINLDEFFTEHPADDGVSELKTLLTDIDDSGNKSYKDITLNDFDTIEVTVNYNETDYSIDLPSILHILVPVDKVGKMHNILDLKQEESEELIYRIIYSRKNKDDIIESLSVQYWPAVAEKRLGITEFSQLALQPDAFDLHPFFSDDYELSKTESNPYKKNSSGLTEIYIFTLKAADRDSSIPQDESSIDWIDSGDWDGFGTDNDGSEEAEHMIYYKPYNKHRMISELGFYRVPKFNELYSSSMGGYNLDNYTIPGIFTPTWELDPENTKFIAKLPLNTEAFRFKLYGEINDDFDDITYFEPDLLKHNEIADYDLPAGEGWFRMASKLKVLSILLEQKDWMLNENDFFAENEIDETSFDNWNDFSHLLPVVDSIYGKLSPFKLIQLRKLSPEYIFNKAGIWNVMNSWLDGVLDDGLSDSIIDAAQSYFDLDVVEFRSFKIRFEFFRVFLPFYGDYLVWKYKYGKFIEAWMQDYLALITKPQADKEYFYYLAKLKFYAGIFSDINDPDSDISKIIKEAQAFNESFPFADDPNYNVGGFQISTWGQLFDNLTSTYHLEECLDYYNRAFNTLDSDLDGLKLISSIIADVNAKYTDLVDQKNETNINSYNFYLNSFISDRNRETSALINYLIDVERKIAGVNSLELDGKLFDYQDREIIEYNKIIMGLLNHWNFINRFDPSSFISLENNAG